MIGAPDVDEAEKAAVDLGLVIGDVAGEIGVAAVRLDQRPVDVVAEIGGAEQRLLAILPILGGLALGRRQAAFVDDAAPAQILDRLAHPVDAALGAGQRPLGGENLVT